MLARQCLQKGSGTPLLFLHGFLGTGSDWLPIIPFFQDKTCIAIDLPGHGSSPYTEEFEVNLTDLPLFHLIGYSMGGRLALKFAQQYPKKIASLTLISTHFGLPENEREARLKADARWAEKILREPFDDFLTEWYDQPVFKTIDPKEMIAMRRRGQNPPLLAKALMFYSLGNQPLYQIPALHLIGEHDLKFRNLYGEKSVIIPNASHAVHLEQPQLTAKAILEHYEI